MSEKKDQQITVRVTKEEKREIERRAEVAGRSVSRYLAELALSDEQEYVTHISDEGVEKLTEALLKLHGDITNMRGNLNQIAKQLSMGVYQGSRKAVNRAAEAAEQAADEILEKVERLS